MPEEAKQEESSEQLKKRAIKRVVAASVLALLAAVGLTVITHQKPTAPAPVAVPATQPQLQPEQTVLPAEPPASAVHTMQPMAPEPQPVSVVAATPPERAAPPAIAPPPPPLVVNVPQAPSEPPHKTAKPAAVKPFKEAESPAKPAPAIAPPVVEKSAKPRAIQELVPIRETAAKANEAAAKASETKASEVKKPVEMQKIVEPAKPVASPSSAPTSQPGKGYAVQLGVFSNPTNAIQMQEKLSQHGIQSYTETKLHVGPFQNKAEAEQALAKVRSLGIGAVVVPLR